MNFNTNLQNLRKIHNLSQEQLAEKLDVSRQAVSKWENGTSYPEMDKLLILCDIFSLNMDELVKGNISLDDNSFKEDKALYENAQNKFSKMITLGVFLIFLGVTIMSMSDGLINGGNFFINTFSSISTILFFIFVLLQLPFLLNRKFYPSFSAFTFPLVICAIAFQKTGLYYQLGTLSFLTILIYLSELLAIIIVVYVWYGFIKDSIETN